MPIDFLDGHAQHLSGEPTSPTLRQRINHARAVALGVLIYIAPFAFTAYIYYEGKVEHEALTILATRGIVTGGEVLNARTAPGGLFLSRGATYSFYKGNLPAVSTDPTDGTLDAKTPQGTRILVTYDPESDLQRPFRVTPDSLARYRSRWLMNVGLGTFWVVFMVVSGGRKRPRRP